MSNFKSIRKEPARLTDAQISEHLEATSFRGRSVSRADIDRARRLLEYGARHTKRVRRPPTLIPGDYH